MKLIDCPELDCLTIDLEWSKVGVHRKDVDKLQRRKYVCRSEKTLESMSEPT